MCSAGWAALLLFLAMRLLPPLLLLGGRLQRMVMQTTLKLSDAKRCPSAVDVAERRLMTWQAGQRGRSVEEEGGSFGGMRCCHQRWIHQRRRYWYYLRLASLAEAGRRAGDDEALLGAVRAAQCWVAFDDLGERTKPRRTEEVGERAEGCWRMLYAVARCCPRRHSYAEREG